MLLTPELPRQRQSSASQVTRGEAMSERVNLVWFRSDLRTADNPALLAASREAGATVAVFLVAEKQWQSHFWSAAKRNLQARQLRDLAARLDKLGIPLLIREAPRFRASPRVLLGLTGKMPVVSLWFNREYGLDERQRDRAVEHQFAEAGIAVHTRDDQCILRPGTVRTQSDEMYKVFTPFKRKWMEQLETSGWQPLPSPEPQARPELDADTELPEVETDTSAPGQDWAAGEDAAQQRLQDFANERLQRYHQWRDRPDVAGTSGLSPYLALGILSARQCLAAVLDDEQGAPVAAGEGAMTWRNELIWREFYRHLLWHHPELCKGEAFKPDLDSVTWRDDDQAFAAWCEGRTGFPLVDAAMRQLVSTGWMHNRLRMVTAVFLTKHLMIDWRRGEQFFMEHLIDGDFASNNGGWQWSASTGADAAPYFRIFNPILQSRKFDPDGVFIRRHVPELESLERPTIHMPDPDTAARLNYPEPMVDAKVAARKAKTAFAEARGRYAEASA